MPSTRRSHLFIVCFLLLATTPVAYADDFALRDGDTVAFLGDSITAARTYGKIIENYTLLRFPDRKVRFINVGQGGDTAAGGLKRLDRDVFQNHATVLTVAYGVNDIGWGLRADDKHKQIYLDGIRGIVEACKKHGVRVYICSAAATGADPFTSEDSFLQKMCDEGMALSRSLGGQSIDVQRSMREVQKRIATANAKQSDKSKHDTLHTADTIHLNELGQVAMAYAILKGLGAPGDVSSVALDAREGKLLKANGCTVSGIETKNGTLEFTRLDQGLPLNYGLFFALHFRFIPIPEELNHYMLSVVHLPRGQYVVLADGRSTGNFSSEQLAAGVNLASATADPWEPGGPWDAQANLLQLVTNGRDQLAMARSHAQVFLPRTDTTETLQIQTRQTDEQIVAMQRQLARPRPYRFVIRPYEPPAKDKK